MLDSSIHIFTAASHRDVLALIAMMTVLLITARTFGEIMIRLKQPAVIGEIAAGIVLGPSLLSHFLPAMVGYVMPNNQIQGYLLEAISMIGAMFLLILAGLETDLILIRRHARVAVSTATGGLILPLLSGFVLGQCLPANLLVDPNQRFIFSMFLATAMSISAIPVIAKVLMELKLIRRDIGQTILAAGMIDDTVGWILLSIVTGLATGVTITGFTILGAVIKVLLFMTISFTAGRWIVKKALDFAQDNIQSPYRLLTVLVVMAFGWASISQFIHLEAVLGAFVVGILFGQMPRLPQKVREQLESISLGIFSPIFFAVAGLKVNLVALHQAHLWKSALVVIGVATLGKVVGTYIGARTVGRQDPWRSLAFGAALNARGAMEIIVATIGLSLNILTQEMFSIIVLMAITTSLMSPFALRWILKHIKVSPEEKERLQKEHLAKSSAIQNIHRVLIPLRKPHEPHQINFIQVIKSRLLQKLASQRAMSITLLNTDDAKFKESNVQYLQQTAELFKENNEVMVKFVASTDASQQILEEAKKDYDLIMLGASEYRNDRQYLFSRLIDSVVKLSPCTTMVVNAKNIAPDWMPNNILVPTNGSNASKNAAELSFLLAPSPEQKVFVLNVIEENPRLFLYTDEDDPHFKNQMNIAQKVVDDIGVLGELHQVQVIKQVKIANVAEEAIIQIAEHQKIDLIILGTEIHPGSTRLFLGPNVERILQRSPCPVVILNAVY